jgi:hypothetical protein
MSTVTLRRLRPELAAQLGELELGAALVERDARNGRAMLAEIGIVLPAKRRRLTTAVRGRSEAMLQAAIRTLLRIAAWHARILRSPSLAAGLRNIRRWIIDCLVGLALASVTAASLVLAILVMAPPD